MIWLKRVLVSLLSVVLLLSLIGVAITVSARVNLANPNKVSSWLNQSGLYGYINNRVIDQAQQAIGSSNQSSQLIAVINNNIKSALPQATLQQDIDNIVNNNYAWLEGKSKAPDFKIDLTSAKKDFALNMGAYIQTRLASLPLCSLSQSLKIQVDNPFTLTCRPVGIDPSTAGAQAASQIENSTTLLGNPVITASTINPNNNNTDIPYYQKFSNVPTIYQWSLKSPWIIGLLAVICAFCIVFLSSLKSKGVRRIGVVLLLSGLSLLTVKFTSDSLTKSIDHYISSNSGLGSIRTILVGFINRIEAATVKVDYWIGIFYLILALIIFILLVAFHKRGREEVRPAKPASETIVNKGQGIARVNSNSSRISPGGPQTSLDSLSPEVSPNRTEKITTAPLLKQNPSNKRFLIQ